MVNLVITIDGPAASGKSTVALLLAEKLGVRFLDTGAMYRTVTLAAMQAKVDLNDEKKLLKVMETTNFQFSSKQGKMAAYINGLDVTEKLRNPQITANARYIASAPKLREKLVRMQRQFATNEEKIVTEGRDQGTVAFADADIKFYLTADVKERARRRHAEICNNGKSETLEQIQKAIEERDKSDRNRANGPLKPAEDAIIVDTTDLTIEEVLKKLLNLVEEKCLKKD